MYKRQHRNRYRLRGNALSAKTRAALAQNSLISPRLVRKLVSRADLRADDTVIDIGAGRGIITAELMARVKRVIAIERDPRLVQALRERFRSAANVMVVECDFMKYRSPVNAYKVFANIPFNMTAAIVRQLVESPICEAHLIMQKEPAMRFAGLPHETLLSVQYKALFDIGVVHRFRRTDFHPVPDVDPVLLRIARRDVELVGPLERRGYAEFVHYGFTRNKQDLRHAYKDVFSYTQWKRIARSLDFPLNATSTQLSVDQWVGLFQSFLQHGKKRDP